MSKVQCPDCGSWDAHADSCPQMFWLELDGTRTRRRGTPEPLPTPEPYTGDPRKFRYSNPGGAESRMAKQMSEIFRGITEKMVRRHIAESRAAHPDLVVEPPAPAAPWWELMEL